MKKIVVKNLDEFQRFLTKTNFDIFSLDTETTSLDYDIMQLEGISLCDGNLAAYIDFTTLKKFDKLEIKKSLSNLLIQADLVIMHNAPFDLKVLYKEKIGITKNIYCTMTAIHLLNENSKYGLKDCAVRVLKVPKSEIKKYDEVKDLDRSSSEFYEYAFNDAIWTYQLWEKTSLGLIKNDLEDLFYDIEMPFQFVLRDMEINGIYLDTEQIKKFDIELTKIIDDSQTFMLKELNINWYIQSNFLDDDEKISPVNFNSTKQLAEILRNRFNCELPTTKKENYQIDTSVIQKYKDTVKFVQYLDIYRQACKLKSTYIKKFISDSDNRFRGSFNNCGTVTGRISSNLQQLPKEMSNDLGIKIRNCFIAASGKDLIVADYSGQELRGLAHVSQDKVMMEAFLEDIDLHLTTANTCFKLDIPKEKLYRTHPDYAKVCEKFKTERYDAKNKINFPIAYGTTEYGMSKSLNVTVEKAKEYLDLFFETYPGVKPAITECSNLLRKKGCVRTELGRYRHLKAVYSSNKYESGKAKRQAFNHRIQGLFADVLRIASANCLELADENPDWDLRILLLVHDEIVFECNSKYTEEIKLAIKEILENAYKLSIPLPVDINSGKIYGEIK